MGDGDLLLMPGLRDGGRGASVKIVTVMPATTPVATDDQAVVALFDAGSGEPLPSLTVQR